MSTPAAPANRTCEEYGWRRILPSVRTALRQIIPPALLNIGRRVLRPPQVFATYTEAATACSQGYDSARVAEIVVAKTKRLRDTGNAEITARTLTIVGAALLAARDKPMLKVLDFGGAAGAHYFAVRRLIDCPMRWLVVETEAMTTAALRVMKTPDLDFSSNVASARAALGGPPDLVISSGTLQYVPDPIATLRELLAIGSPVMCLTRTETGREPSITIQRSRLSENGPGPLPDGFEDGEISYPRSTLDGGEIEREMGNHYRVFSWDEEATETGQMRGYLGLATGQAQ
jgi:putative methyltransferase (TIGR04325 family)